MFKERKSVREETGHSDTSTFYHVLLHLSARTYARGAYVRKKKWAARQTCMLHTHTYVRHTYTRMRAFTCISIPLTGISSIACLGMNEPLRHALVLTGPLPQPSSSLSRPLPPPPPPPPRPSLVTLSPPRRSPVYLSFSGLHYTRCSISNDLARSGSIRLSHCTFLPSLYGGVNGGSIEMDR